MDGRGRSLSDEALDRDIATALNVDASPEFLARVRTRIASEPSSVGWFPAFPARALVPAAGLAAVVIAFAVWRAPGVEPSIARSSVPIRAPDGQVTSGRENTDIGNRNIRSLETARPVDRRGQVVTSAALEAERIVPLHLSPVVVSENERRAFAMFVTAASEGRIPQAQDDTAAADDSLVVAAFTIEPLVIDPLPALARVELQGEGQW